MTKRWILRRKKIDDVIAQLLFNRGIKTKKQQEQFLSPHYERDVGDPFKIKGMKKAVARIKKAIERKENIGIFGDYDVDGVCASIVLHDFFEKVGVNPFFETYLPDRTKDGYGLNRQGMSYFKEHGVTLIITVDCGITDHKEIAWAGEQGIDVIVTDHHEVSQGLPPAYVVIDPKQKGEKYPFSGLAGTGVAFKLAQALRQSISYERISEAWEKWLLDLVAFATVADQMPLVFENRAIVKYGLLVLSKTRRLGLKELIHISGLNPATISVEDMLFQLAPRVNAASRIDHALVAFKLLTTSDPTEAHALARKIDQANKTRQRVVAKTLADLQQRIEKKFSTIKRNRLIFEGSSEVPPGVCGLVANKLIDRYGYPTFIYSVSPQGVKGSVRSLPPFSVVQAMRVAKDLLLDWGGHHQAGGFSLEEKNLAKFEAALKRQTKLLTAKDLTPSLSIDTKLEPAQITLDLWDKLQELAPFGKGNPEPVFLLRGARLYGLKKVGSAQDHLKLTLEKDEKFFEGIYFNGANDKRWVKQGDIVDIAFHLKRSNWKVSTLPELRILDLHHAH